MRNEKCLIYTKVEGLDLSGEKAKLQKKARRRRFLGPTGGVQGEKVSSWGCGFGSQVSLFLGWGGKLEIPLPPTLKKTGIFKMEATGRMIRI